MDKLLTLEEAAECFGTSVRFARRLVAERRIRFIKVGRHVRIPDSAIAAFITENTVEPISVRWRAGRVI